MRKRFSVIYSFSNNAYFVIAEYILFPSYWSGKRLLARHTQRTDVPNIMVVWPEICTADLYDCINGREESDKKYVPIIPKLTGSEENVDAIHTGGLPSGLCSVSGCELRV